MEENLPKIGFWRSLREAITHLLSLKKIASTVLIVIFAGVGTYLIVKDKTDGLARDIGVAILVVIICLLIDAYFAQKYQELDEYYAGKYNDIYTITHAQLRDSNKQLVSNQKQLTKGSTSTGQSVLDKKDNDKTINGSMSTKEYKNEFNLPDLVDDLANK